MLELNLIKKDYVTSSETVHALKGVSIAFRQKEFVSILGPSGCGKTTLLNIIGGLDHYTDGDLVISGKSTKFFTDRDWDVYRNHRVGFIFQSYNLIPHQTILGNVELALTIAGLDKETRIAKAKLALDRVGLANQYYKKPNQLSGGQCQRVAIARALVNDPEILLADEPTGALDTVTSVQIMDLIKEISGERLVVMVTHNPELAEHYSSRIIRLVDGNVTEDTNPMTDEEVRLENEERERIAREEAEAIEALPEEEKKVAIKQKKRQKEKAKMSLLTAFKLSARNLLSKRGRTIMVGIAGSIGIIGIALVLAFSAGIKGYIAYMQDDLLSGNPIQIAETAYDLDAFTTMMDNNERFEHEKKPSTVFINSIISNLVKMNKDMNNIITKNDITAQYVDYIKAMPEEYYSAMIFGYGINPDINIYTGLTPRVEENEVGKNGEEQLVSIKHITDMYTAILENSEYKEFTQLLPTLMPQIKVAPDDESYILDQYDVMAGKVATEKDEIMLVLSQDEQLTDLLLAKFGYYTQEEFMNVVMNAEKKHEELPENYKHSFSYDELLGKKFYYYNNDAIFTVEETPMTAATGMYNLGYKSNMTGASADGQLPLKVVGILMPKENISYGSMQSGIYYTSALTEHMLAENKDSKIIETISSFDEEMQIGMNLTDMATQSFGIKYSFNYYYDDLSGVKPTEEICSSTVSFSTDLSGAMASMMPGASGAQKVDTFDLRDRLVRALAGNGLANKIHIYPVSFDEKQHVTEYLDKWNSDEDIIVDGEHISQTRTDITYVDNLGLIITMINTMIDIISYALIAFTSVSLVVSTVMIGIITYVSVVERIKEIGVIRSLGGRKKDVSHLFNAETFIIGLLAGIIGIGATYLISAIVNLILKPLIGYASIAALPISQALILILLSVVLTSISGLIPAKSAANKDPVVALRTE